MYICATNGREHKTKLPEGFLETRQQHRWLLGQWVLSLFSNSPALRMYYVSIQNPSTGDTSDVPEKERSVLCPARGSSS